MGKIILFMVEGFVSLALIGLVGFYLYKLGRFIYNIILKGIKK